MFKSRALMLYAILACALAGCGQTGPLYLPEPTTLAAPAAGSFRMPAASTRPPVVKPVTPPTQTPPPRKTR